MKTKSIARKAVAALLTLTLMFSVITASSVAVSAESGSEWLTMHELIDEKGFINGVQANWMRRNSPGNCIGTSWLGGYDNCNYEPELWREFFINAKAMGYDCVKVWLTYNWGGIQFDEDYHVVGFTKNYEENLIDILDMTQEIGVYFSPTIIDHFEGFDAANDENGKYTWDRRAQFLYNDEYTDEFIENWYKPLIEILSRYENVTLIDLFCEAEANGGRWDVLSGTNWEQMRKFIKRLNDEAKAINPNIETYCSTNTAPKQLTKYYDGLGLDYHGRDEYTSDGSVASGPVSNFYLDKPLIYGEYGITNGTSTFEYKANYLTSYLNNVVNGGVKAAFWWQYGWPSNGVDLQSVAGDKQGRVCPTIINVHDWALDREYGNTGYVGLDKPAMMYTDADYVRFVGSRNATKYRVIRSTDKKNWTDVLVIDSSNEADYTYGERLFEFTDDTIEEEMIYYYRVVAYGANDQVVSSDISSAVYIPKTTCSDEENLISNGSFEEDTNVLAGTGNGKWAYTNQSAYPTTYVSGGVEGETTYSGDNSMNNISRIWQNFTVKPNTNYTITFKYRFLERNDAFYGMSFKVLYDYGTSQPGTKSIATGRIPLELRDGTWRTWSLTFNSLDNTSLRFAIDCYRTATSCPDWYVDDVYIFES